MSSYQSIDNTENQNVDLLPSHIEDESESNRAQKIRRYWQIFSLICVVGLVGGVAVTGEMSSRTRTANKLSAQASPYRASSSSSSESDSSTTGLIVRAEGEAIRAYATMSTEDQRGLFESFKTKYAKKYATTDEEESRFATFQANLALIDARNTREGLIHGRATHGITKFTDNTADEINAMLGYKKSPSDSNESDRPASNGQKARRRLEDGHVEKPSTKAGSKVESKPSTSASTNKPAAGSTVVSAPVIYKDSTVSSVETEDLVESETEATGAKTSETVVSWVGIYTTPVKNQGYCGSCWAFSATEQIESDSIRAGITTKFDYFSEQQIVDCDKADFGCDGGSTETAYRYIEVTGGIESATDYPYVSKDGKSTSCTSDSSDYKVTVDRFRHIYDEDEMVDYVLSTGPLSVCLDASSWYSYDNGILHDCGDSVDHCVQIVGVNTEENYWMVRNSWGTDWGVDGYIYLNLYNNTCDITYDPSYVSVSSV